MYINRNVLHTGAIRPDGAVGESSLKLLTSYWDPSYEHFEFSHFILYMLCMLISLEAKYVQNEEKNSGYF